MASDPRNPATWRTNADGSLVCPHRDLSVCAECAGHPEVTDVMGAHFHMPADGFDAWCVANGELLTDDDGVVLR